MSVRDGLDWWLMWEAQATTGSTIPRKAGLACTRAQAREEPASSVSPWFLPGAPAMTSLNYGAWPGSMRWNQPFPLLGQSVLPQQQKGNQDILLPYICTDLANNPQKKANSICSFVSLMCPGHCMPPYRDSPDMTKQMKINRCLWNKTV